MSGATAVPWYVWSSTLAVTSTTVGLYWDIFWPTGIGRDTFWTPAHLAIQLGTVLTRALLRLFDSAHHILAHSPPKKTTDCQLLAGQHDNSVHYFCEKYHLKRG